MIPSQSLLGSAPIWGGSWFTTTAGRSFRLCCAWVALGKRQSPGHTAPQPAQHSKISDGPYWAKSVWAVMKHITNSQWMQIGLTYWSVTPGSRTKLRSNAERLQITITPAIHNWNITDSAVSRFVKNNFKYCSLLLHLLILWFYWYANFWWTAYKCNFLEWNPRMWLHSKINLT